jgi:hypothetical protein
LRTDVVDDRNVCRLDAPGESKIEIWKVDQDSCIGGRCFYPVCQTAEYPVQTPKLAERGKRPHCGGMFNITLKVNAGSPHLLAA